MTYRLFVNVTKLLCTRERCGIALCMNSEMRWLMLICPNVDTCVRGYVQYVKLMNVVTRTDSRSNGRTEIHVMLIC